MPLISKLLRLRAVSEKDIVIAYNRELVPLLEEIKSLILSRIGEVVEISSNYTVSKSDGHILVDASNGPVTISLIDSSTTRNRLSVHKIDFSENHVSIVGNTNGAGNIFLVSPNDSVDLYPSNSFGWVLIG